VAVFDSPLDGTRLLKRVAAAAATGVRLRASHPWINGRPLHDAKTQGERFGLRRVRLDLDQGGGRASMLAANSADGRYFGSVPASALHDRAFAVYWRSGKGLGWKRL